MSSRITTHAQGFTLVEVLVYLAVFMLVSVGSILTLLNLREMVYEQRVNQILTQSVSAVFERVQNELRSGDSIDFVSSTFGVSSSTVTIMNGATSTEIALVDNSIVASVNGGVALQLTPDTVTVTEFTLYHYDNGVSEAVRVSLDMEATWGTVVKSKSFTNAATLMSSYD